MLIFYSKSKEEVFSPFNMEWRKQHYGVHYTDKSQKFTEIPFKSTDKTSWDNLPQLLLSRTAVALNQCQDQLDYH